MSRRKAPRDTRPITRENLEDLAKDLDAVEETCLEPQAWLDLGLKDMQDVIEWMEPAHV